MKKRTMALLAAVLLVVGVAIGGTLAWLTAQSDTVTNTFTTSDINITLAETTGNEYKMIPGHTITKDPKVTVTAGSEDCYLFVKLEKLNNYNDYLTYTVDDTLWQPVPNETDVYYRKVPKEEVGTDYYILKDNQVSVKGEVTKEMMNSLTEATYPQLKITAYATQLYENNNTEFEVEDAWKKVKPSAVTP